MPFNSQYILGFSLNIQKYAVPMILYPIEDHKNCNIRL